MSQLPPFDLSAEHAVVSAALLSTDALGVSRDLLRTECFFDLKSQIVFDALCRVDDSGARPDIVTVTSAIRDKGQLDRLGGTAGLAEFFDASPNITHVSEHCAIVLDKYRLRKIMDICRVHAVAAHGDVGNVAEYCARVEKEILEATDGASSVNVPQTIGEILKEELPKITDRQSSASGIVSIKNTASKSGIEELDTHLWGGFDNNFYVIAGRPSMGKSAFAGTIALNTARGTVKNRKPIGDGKSTVFFSCEMPKEQLALRFLSSETLVPYKRLRLEKLNPEEWDSVLEAVDRISSYPLSIHHEPGAHVQRVKSIVRREFSRMNRAPGAVIIDYLQLLRGDLTKGGNREQEVAGISRHCMEMPKEFRCPVFGLSQLNRSLESRPNKRPLLSDLRESGALEQDAYGVIFLYRDVVYHPETEDKDMVEIIVAKNRNGETGTINAKFDGPCVRFCSMNQQFYDDIGDINDSLL